ncbi:MAG TPA: helix-turn-helix domain-containing protein [Patescibacteria group bacterium]|nr:helix-turn-helix domain-containing protein [Patescibacteria group bacterium]
MDPKQLLLRLGLSENGANIYLSLVERGSLTVSDIAKATGIHRPIVYKHLPELLDHNLVTTTKKGKRTLYVPESPRKLESLVDETKSDLKEMMPGLQEAFSASGKRPIVKYIEGGKGITFVMSDVVHSLKRGDIWYRYSSSTKDTDKFLPKDYRKVRDAKSLERFVITSEEYTKRKKPRMDRAMKTVPKEFGLFDHDVTLIIYGDKVAYMDYNSESVLIIENKIIAEFQKNLFKVLYSKL